MRHATLLQLTYDSAKRAAHDRRARDDLPDDFTDAELDNAPVDADGLIELIGRAMENMSAAELEAFHNRLRELARADTPEEAREVAVAREGYNGMDAGRGSRGARRAGHARSARGAGAYDAGLLSGVKPASEHYANVGRSVSMGGFNTLTA